MASGIVGGAHSKIKGQVGGTIYQIRRNPDGSYSQIEYAKGQQTSSSTTPRLQAQRMCMAMVQSMMNQLKPIARISMQSGANKSKSLNAFSNNNVRLVANDCKANWYTGNQFVYPEKKPDYSDVNDLGGAWLISSGTLNFNIWDSEIFDNYPEVKFRDVPIQHGYFYGLQFNVTLGLRNVGEFLRKHKMTRLDKFVFCAFRVWYEWNDDNEESIEHTEHTWLIAQVNPMIPDNVMLYATNIKDLFVFESNFEVTQLISWDNDCLAVGFLCDYQNKDEHCYYTAAFTESHLTGRKLISSSSYKLAEGGDTPWLVNHAPADVFGTWIGDPTKKPYPNIFE